jgi:hypothetical protein
MASASDRAKRILVTLLKSLAAAYGFVLGLTRESGDKDVQKAFKKVLGKVTGEGGSNVVARRKSLNAARDAWQDAVQQARGQHGGKSGRNADQNTGGEEVLEAAAWEERRAPGAGFRVRSRGVLLTYQKFPDTSVWERFLGFVADLVAKPGVRYWGATLETN